MKSILLNPSKGSIPQRDDSKTIAGNQPCFSYRRFSNKMKSILIPVLLLLLGNLALGQNLTQTGFTGVTVPQYMASGNTSRMMVMFRATVSGLTASTSYRYFINGAINTDLGTTNPGAGNPLLISPSGTTYTYSSGASITSAGNYETFTTDASGNYTGWFGFVNTGNARFTAGNVIYPTIVIGSSTGTTLFRRALDQTINVLAFGTTSAATNGTFIKSTTSATAKNIVVLYDNTAGTGRPLSVTVVENISAAIASIASPYSTAAGTWNTIIPNSNANGLKRIEQRSVTANTLLGCATDTDGVWPTGSINTVNPTGSTTSPLAINSADDALIACGGTALISTSGTLSAVNTTYGTASAFTTFTASGSSLTTDITINAPSGYEISKTGGASGYAASQVLSQSGGAVASTTIYVRIAAATLFGNYSGNVTLTSAPATAVNVATVLSSVAKKALTVTGVSADNNTYDRTTAATISGATASGTVNGDAITISGGGTFASATVGTGITVTPALTFSGTNSGSYTLTQPSGLSADIIAKDLTISGISAANKIYDGNADAVLSGTLSGVIAPDDVTLVLSAGFDSAGVDIAIPVTSFSSIVGGDAGNYNLVQPSGLTADITAKELTISGATAQNKTFDGNTDATITGTLVGVIAPDDVTLVGTGTFAQSTVGLNIPVTSTSTIVGDIANYTLVQPTGLTANITAGPLTPQTISFDPLSDVVYGDANFNLTATASSGLTVSYSSSDTTVATVSGNTVTIVGVGTTTITATQSGDLTYDSATPVDQSLTVTPKELTVLASADNKVYDGTDTATITGTLSGIIGSDDVTFIGTGNFVSTAAATGIEVTSTATLGGADASNYTLAQPLGLTADITPLALTISGAVADNKIYDGNTTATISGAGLVGVIGIDDVTVSGNGTFADANVANSIAVTANLTLSGTNAGNYSLIQPAGLSANITPLALTISGISGTDKVYDRTTTATLGGTPILNGTIGLDNVSVSGTVSALFNNKNVGTAKPITVTGYTLSGLQAGNYSVSQPTGINADITAATVTITGAVAQDKPFDGTTAATITGTLSGVISPDVVTLVGTGTFASSAIGNGIAVTSTSTLAGADGGNYIISPQPTGLTANIVSGPTVLAVGDLSIIGFNFNAPDNFAFVAWVDLLPNTLIKFTDNGFLAAASANAANNARGGENILIWKNNGATIPAGTVITIQDNSSASGTNVGTIVSGNLNGLSASGDNIFAYQGAATSGAAPDYSANANPATFNGTILFGLYAQASSAIATWISTGTASSNSSYLPTQLNVANGNIALGSSSTRGQYSGLRNNQVSFNGYKALVTNPGNWTIGASSGVAVLNTTSFTLATPPTASVISGIATICVGEASAIAVTITGGTAPYSVVYTDGSNNFTVNGYVSGTNIAVSPTVTTTYTLVSVTDANTLVGTGNSGSAVITVNQLYPFFADNDGDTYGAGSSVNKCAVNATTPPAGFSVNNTDCNDSIAAINPGAVEIAYNGVDDNCNGSIDEGYPQITTSLLASDCNSTLASIGSLVGIQTLAPGALYTGWRIRATNGVQVQVIEKNVPHFTMMEFPSYAYATTYTIDIQLQRNGVWLGYYGPTCQISTPAVLAEGGAASVSPSQCGIVLPKINTLIATTSLAGVTGY
ncbi:MAG TPA: YDG domain-containing protein, partial [Flavobacterium sp.]|nr:YDG domain-containing protein [Flavobacterium sp.]